MIIQTPLGETAVTEDAFQCNNTSCLAQTDDAVAVVRDLNDLINQGLAAIGDSARLASGNTFGAGSVQLMAKVIYAALPYLRKDATADYEEYAALALLHDDPSEITPAVIKKILTNYTDARGMLGVAITAYKQRPRASFWSRYKWYILGAGVATCGIGAAVIYTRKSKRATPALAPAPGVSGLGESMQSFIRSNKKEIDAAIKRVCPNCRLNDSERRAWILNDEGLYNWARSAGVRI